MMTKNLRGIYYSTQFVYINSSNGYSDPVGSIRQRSMLYKHYNLPFIFKTIDQNTTGLRTISAFSKESMVSLIKNKQ